MKKFLIIIGLTLLVGIQITNADDCTSTLYKDEFSCKSQKAYSYCSSNVSRKNVKYNLYESAYCNSEINNTDKVYEAVANQLVAEDPQWDKKLVKGVLINLTQYGIDEYLKDKYSSTDSNTISKLPKAIQEVYRGGQIGQQAKIYKRIKRAYDKQRVIQHGQESLKQQFKAREMWANASLNDSPFDLVVDLNLIEIMLFGNKAKWTSENDVWSWPEDEEEKKKKSKIPNSSPKQSKAGSPTTPSAKPTTSSTANEYECVADKTTKKPTSNPGIVPKNCGNKKLEKGEE